jgi:hypothetical protein
MKDKPLTFYPGQSVKRAIGEISEADHNRPKSHVVELAVKAFATLWAVIATKL